VEYCRPIHIEYGSSTYATWECIQHIHNIGMVDELADSVYFLVTLQSHGHICNASKYIASYAGQTIHWWHSLAIHIAN